MKFSNLILNRFFKIFIIVGVILGIFARLYHFYIPREMIFDEHHFVDNAVNYLAGHVDYNDHPPLGKYLIAIGILLFGNNTVGWRCIPLLLNFTNLLLAALLIKKLFSRMTYAWLAVFCLAIDGMMIVYSKTAHLEGMMLTSILLTLLLASEMKRPWQVLPVAFVIGLGISLKWNVIAVIIPVLYMAWHQRLMGWMFLSFILSFMVYELIVVSGQMVTHSLHPWSEAWQWSRNNWIHHASLNQWTHPLLSKWWTWPFLIKPIVFWNHSLPVEQKVEFVTSLGNPLLWWSSSFIVILDIILAGVLFFRERAKAFLNPRLPFILGWISFIFPWALTSRDTYMYHYFPAYGFSLLLLAVFLGDLWELKRGAALIVISVFLCVSIFFLPVWIGYPIPQTWLSHYIWFKKWG